MSEKRLVAGAKSWTRTTGATTTWKLPPSDLQGRQTAGLSGRRPVSRAASRWVDRWWWRRMV
ncbi:hypothetical protein Csa_001129 [Cucumis sativus]|nr:hypothetical protein Csa_001129 [Cucumis sativus]